jgi:hypothetical protein
MKRRTMAPVVGLALLVGAGVASALAQASFQIPFPFQAGGKKFVSGAYTLAKAADGGLVLRQASSGKETAVPALERMPKSGPPVGEPRLVFDEVGDFAPSYTEYITVYVLSEVWLPGEDGFRIHVTKGAHKTKVVTAGAVLPIHRPD